MARRPLAVFTAIAATLTAILLAPGISASPAAASDDQSYWVPRDKAITVRGHGFGHGHGMSQYGAQGAALQGQRYRQIIDFYYPGTSWSTVRGTLRVLVTADTTSDVVVSPVAGLTVRDRGDGATYALPSITGVKRWRIAVGADNEAVVGYLTGRWHRWEPRGKTALVGDGEFFATTPLTLWTPSGSRSYRGTLRAASPREGSSDRDTVNVVSMDQYTKGVVPYEMPASWQPEAVRAQAVAARTYAAWSREQNKSRYYQICDTTSCQVYGGVVGEDSRSNAAVDATANQILTYDAKPAFTQFSSSSGGWTAAGGVPYLPAKRDGFDRWAGNHVHDWSVTVDAGRLERAHRGLGTLRRILVVRRDGHGDWGGRVRSIVLDGTDADVTISGDSFRWLYGLRSSWFTIDPTPIISRWTKIGGAASVLGPVRTGEYAVQDGSAQRFRSGRIFYSRATGARELYGPILDKYRAMGGAGSRLGWPVRSNYATRSGQRANFEHGYITWSRDTLGTRVRIIG